MNIKRIIASAAIVAVAGIGAVACGGSGNSSAATPQASTQTNDGYAGGGPVSTATQTAYPSKAALQGKLAVIVTSVISQNPSPKASMVTLDYTHCTGGGIQGGIQTWSCTFTVSGPVTSGPSTVTSPPISIKALSDGSWTGLYPGGTTYTVYSDGTWSEMDGASGATYSG